MPNVVVLGSGYAGAGAVQSLESELDRSLDITWISDTEYHLVLHEVHRCLRDPSVEDKIAIPIEDIKSPETDFIQGFATDIDTEQRRITLADGDSVEYDYLLVAVGSQTAFFGIDGLEEYAHTVNSLDDVRGIRAELEAAVEDATPSEPAQVIVGGAGLSGIQTTGEIAEVRDEWNEPIDIHLVEGLDSIFPNNDSSVQTELRTRLEELGIDILTGEFVERVDETTVYVGEDTELEYDVLIWTGGITGRECIKDVEVTKNERNHRLNAEMSFQTDDERVFAIGDCALIDQPNDAVAPPTAEAAWEAADHVGKNIARQIRGEDLEKWTFESKGTAISVGEDAVAHDVQYIPFETFGGFPAQTLKKAIAVRWIVSITGLSRGLRAWPDM